jgi:hypothetical protein
MIRSRGYATVKWYRTVVTGKKLFSFSVASIKADRSSRIISLLPQSLQEAD